jgi:Cu/Ag efflux pump CusA
MRRLVVAGVIAVLALGFVQLQDARLDVYPEFEPPAVQVQTEALGLSAEEVEELITTPLEQDLLNGIPWLKTIESQSMPGLSAIDMTFEEGTDLYLARQMVAERMTQAAALPNVGTPPVMVQPTASTSRVAMVAMRSQDVSMVEMSVLARWQMRPRLMAIPGVSQVSIWGQRERQLQVQVDPARLQSNQVTLTQLIETTGNALWVSPLSFVEASTPGTGGFVETPNQRIGIQHVSPITTSDELADVAIEGVAGAPKRLGDVADVIEDHQPLIGDSTHEGERSLMLVIERFPDADVAAVTADVESALQAMSAGLTGIEVDTDVYRPATYLESASNRLGIAALIGAALMLLVVGLLTWSWRIALTTFVSVATSMVVALYVLRIGETPLTTITVLGLAAAAALVVDDVVGDMAAVNTRFRERRETGQPALVAMISAAVVSRRGPLGYATVITFIALAPLLFLTGPAGAFARPALLAFVLAALASFVTALVVTPVLAVMLARQGEGEHRAAPFSSVVRKGYDRVGGAVGRVVPAVLGVVVLLGLVLAGLPSLRSGSLLPGLEDRNVLVRFEAASGTSLAEMDRITGIAAAELRDLAGVSSIGTHVGRAIGADEVVDVDASEVWLTVADDADYDETLDGVRAVVAGYPGLRSTVRTYADDRVTAVSASTGDDLVVRVTGEDYTQLQATAEDVAAALKTVEGVISPQVEQLVTQPTVSVQVDLAAAQRYGLRPGDVRREASALISGLTVGSLYEQQAIFDVVVWGGPQTRSSVELMKDMLVHTPSGQPVRLGDVATVGVAATPTVITHDGVRRTLDVTAEVRGRDAADVAAAATERLRQMTFEDEYVAEVLGDAAERATADRNLLLAAIAAAALAFLLLQAGTNSWRAAAVLFLTVPLAAGGALLAGYLVDGAWSIPVLGAIVAVVALALRQSLVLTRRAQVLHGTRRETAPAEALRAAAREQAPPVLIAVLATAALFVPAAVMGGGAGLEIFQPFAIALLFGLVTSTLVVLFLVPSLLAAVGGLRPTPVIGPDTPDGEPDEATQANFAVQPRPHDNDELTVGKGSAPMNRVRSYGIASLVTAAALGVAGCQTSASGSEAADAIAAAASVEEDPGGGPATLTLTPEALERLRLETSTVEGSAGAMVVPYAAVIYDADGATWTFVQLDEGVFQREAITITSVDGENVVLSAGPQPGTDVVTVAAAELVGVEAGISGGE